MNRYDFGVRLAAFVNDADISAIADVPLDLAYAILNRSDDSIRRAWDAAGDGVALDDETLAVIRDVAADRVALAKARSDSKSPKSAAVIEPAAADPVRNTAAALARDRAKAAKAAKAVEPAAVIEPAAVVEPAADGLASLSATVDTLAGVVGRLMDRMDAADAAAAGAAVPKASKAAKAPKA